MPIATRPAPALGDPTPRQRAIFVWIFEQTARHGYQPNFREVMGHFGLVSPHGILVHVRALRRKGWLADADTLGVSRSLRFLRTPSGAPFCGFWPVEPGDGRG